MAPESLAQSQKRNVYIYCDGGWLFGVNWDYVADICSTGDRCLYDEQKVVEYGVYIMRYFCPFYWMLGILHVLGGTIRGTGKTMQAMVVFLVSLCGFRVMWIAGTMAWTRSLGHVMNVLSDVLASGNATDAFVCMEREMDGSVRPGKIRLFQNPYICAKGNWDKIKYLPLFHHIFYDKIMSIMYS